MKRLLSGIKPTGELTLGNYLGAIKQFVDMQKDYESFIFVANLHAITVYNDKEELLKRTRDLVAIYLACGLDAENTTIFLQSENNYHTNLGWVLECNAYVGELNRMTQFKDKSKNKSENAITCGLYTYPTLMAADIILYDADVVPVGIDQKQHVELTRNIAERFNKRYGQTFKIPEPIISEITQKIYDLQNPTKKMSKTEENPKGCITLLENPAAAAKKIMGAVTDSDNKIKYDPENKPGISNLITIYSALTNVPIKDVENKFKDSNYGTFKKAVAEVVSQFLTDLQAKYQEIINSGKVDEVLDKGIKKAREIAQAKVKEVYEKVGLSR